MKEGEAMANFVVILGHPDPSEARLNRALAHCYADAAMAAGHTVRTIDVATLNFPMLRRADEFLSNAPPGAIAASQADIAWADHLAFFFPLWIGDMPALLKAFVEQTFRPGFAMGYGGRKRFPVPLMRGKSARLVVTMGMPAFAYRSYFGGHSLKAIALGLRMCGVTPVRTTIIGAVGDASERRRRCWFERLARTAVADARPGKTITQRTAHAVAFAVLGSAAAYLGYVARTWSRFGNESQADSLLDDIMPNYDVALDHDVEVRAPAAIAFARMCELSLERSLIVATLFRARALLMRARYTEAGPPAELLTQLQRLGWSIVAEEPGREIVFAAATQPWRADPIFRGMSRDEFVRFDEPGYAKIAFSLCVDPLGPASSVARTQTRVKTTDARSRARFRRYWAFLSPGIEIVRIVLLQRLKAAAESGHKKEEVQTFFTPEA
jgi:putative NADPH-quinone reductase